MFCRTALALLLFGSTCNVHGKIVFTELMIDPKSASDTSSQWFEIYNTATVDVSLDGWVFAFGIGDFCDFLSISATKSIGPFGYLIVGNNANTATNGGIAVDIQVDFLPFAKDGSGVNAVGIGISNDFLDDIVSWSADSWEYPTFPFAPGASLAKVSALGSASDASNWKPSTTSINCKSGTGDKGTPAKINTFKCPPPTKAPTKTPTIAPIVVPVAPAQLPSSKPCGFLRLSILCLNGCGVLGRLRGLCQ